MKKTMLFTGAALLAAVALPVQANAHSATSMKKMSFHVMLSGKAEVPTKGPSKGTGTATVTIDPSKGTVCYSITVKGIDLPAIVDHIHAGKAGVMGNILVPFPSAPGKNGRVVGCARGVKMTTMAAIEAHPTSYYLNVHTKKYSGGAVRGQL